MRCRRDEGQSYCVFAKGVPHCGYNYSPLVKRTTAALRWQGCTGEHQQHIDGHLHCYYSAATRRGTHLDRRDALLPWIVDSSVATPSCGEFLVLLPSSVNLTMCHMSHMMTSSSLQQPARKLYREFITHTQHFAGMRRERMVYWLTQKLQGERP